MSPLYVFTIVRKFSQGAKRPKKEADDSSSKREASRGTYRKKRRLLCSKMASLQQKEAVGVGYTAKGHVPTQVACSHVACAS